MLYSRFNQIKLTIFPTLGTILLCLCAGSPLTGQSNSASFRLSASSGNGIPQQVPSATYQRPASQTATSSLNRLRSDSSNRLTTPRPLIIAKDEIVQPLRANSHAMNRQPALSNQSTQTFDPQRTGQQPAPKTTGYHQQTHLQPNRNEQQGFINFHSSNSLSATEIQELMEQSQLELQKSTKQPVRQSNYAETPAQRTRASQTTFVDGNEQAPSKPPTDNAWNFGAERLDSASDQKSQQVQSNPTSTNPTSTNQARGPEHGSSAELQSRNPSATASMERSTATTDRTNGSTDRTTATGKNSIASDPKTESGAADAKEKSRKPATNDSKQKSLDINQTIKNVSFATMAVLVVSVIAIVALKKLGVTGAGLSPDTSQTAAVVNRTSLNSKCHVHLVQFNHHKIVVGVDQTGIKSMVCLPNSFVEELDGAAEESRTL